MIKNVLYVILSRPHPLTPSPSTERGNRKGVRSHQAGLGLVETLVAVAILGTCVAAFAAGLSAGSLASGEYRVETVAQSLAQNELEHVKRAPFEPAGTYEASAAPAGYDLDIAVEAVPGADANIQKITVIVLRDGDAILTLADYKVNR